MKARRWLRSRRCERFENCGRRSASICTPSPGRPVARPFPAPGSAPGMRMREKVSAMASGFRGLRASWGVPATSPCTPPSTTPRRCSTWAFPSPRFHGQSSAPNLRYVSARTPCSTSPLSLPRRNGRSTASGASGIFWKAAASSRSSFPLPATAICSPASRGSPASKTSP